MDIQHARRCLCVLVLVFYAGCSRQLADRVKAFDAAGDGDVATLKTLIQDKGVNVDAVNEAGEPLLIAALDWPEILAFLLKEGADPNKCIIIPQHAKVYPLFRSVVRGNVSSTRILIAGGADTNKGIVEKCDVTTPLMEACIHARIEIVGILLLNGADPNIKDGAGFTAVDRAMLSSHYPSPAKKLEAARLLCISGGRFQPEKKLATGKTIAQWVAEREGAEFLTEVTDIFGHQEKR